TMDRLCFLGFLTSYSSSSRSWEGQACQHIHSNNTIMHSRNINDTKQNSNKIPQIALANPYRHTHTDTHTHTRTDTHTRLCTHTDTHTHTSTDRHTHTHTHTQNDT